MSIADYNRFYKDWLAATSNSPVLNGSSVTSVTVNNGSIIAGLLDGDGTLLDEFVTVAGELDTDMLLSGDYIKPCVIEFFNNLKKYDYDFSIFDIIKYKLVAFLISIALEHKITVRITHLAKEVFSGVLPIEHFNEVIKGECDTFASEVASKCPLILEKIEKSFIDNVCRKIKMYKFYNYFNIYKIIIKSALYRSRTCDLSVNSRML